MWVTSPQEEDWGGEKVACSVHHRGGRNTGYRTHLQWILLFVITLLVQHTAGVCIDKDIKYQNGSSWFPSPCVSCRCESPLVECDRTVCLDPGCNFVEGDTLEIVPGHCCPVCVSSGQSCHNKGKTYQHQTSWNPVPCEQCACANGEVTCRVITCPNVTCSQNEVQEVTEGQCCPTCKSTERSCVYYGETRDAGSLWQPSPCARCRCDNGVVTCFTLMCPNVNCHQGRRLLTLPGECCPKCVAPPCEHGGRIYQAGSQWKADRCTRCTCKDQEVECRRQSCPTQSCSQDKTDFWMKDRCCPLCIDKGHGCASDGVTRHHGESWYPSPCLMCVCRDRHVTCSNLTCPPLHCQQSEVKQTVPGTCCAVCIEKGSCRHSHGVVKHGTRWQRSSCEFCECNDGGALCFRHVCPHCPPGTLREATPFTCCGQCIPVRCAPACASCLTTNSSHCTSCTRPRRHLQEGVCTTRCSAGFYLHHDGHCAACDNECATCGGPTNQHCLTCGGSAIWENGECVKTCSSGSVLHKGICHECPGGCKQCATTEECTECEDEFTMRAARCVARCRHVAQWDRATRQCADNKGRPHLQITRDISGQAGEVVGLKQYLDAVTDSDSILRHVTYHVVQKPTNGVLLVITGGRDSILRNGDSFSIEQLQNEKIYYRHKKEKPLRGYLQLKVSDGDLVSDTQTVYIKLASPLSPHVDRNRALIVERGTKTEISPAEHLSIGDDDSPGAVTVTIVQAPQHGRILRTDEVGAVTAFSLQDLQQHRLVYVHDNLSSDKHDQMTLQVSDGSHVIIVLFNVIIIEKGRKTPVIVNNLPLLVDEGHEARVTPEVLLAVHPTEGATNVVYTLRASSGAMREHGSFLMVVGLPPSGLTEGWHPHGTNKMAADMTRFRQSDVNHGRIWYKAPERSGKVLEFQLEVCDLARPPHCLTGNSFFVRIIHAPNDAPGPGFNPTLVFVPDEDSRLGTTVFDNEVTVLKASDLGTYIPNAHEEDVEYRVTSALTAGEGTIEHALRPLVPMHTFSLADLVAGNILYRPPSGGIGDESKEVMFKFVVVDLRTDQELPEQEFRVRVLPVTTSPPTVADSSPVVRVTQGESVPVGAGVVKVTDPDTPLQDLLVVVERTPRSGDVIKLGRDSRVVLRQGDQFGLGELLSGLLFYEHDGSASSEDSFYVIVTDGDHSVGVNVQLVINRVDRSAPELHPASSMSLTLPEGTTQHVLRTNMAFTDSDSRDEEVMIVLATEPFHGWFVLTGPKINDPGIKSGFAAIGTSFTQQDINDGNVRFKAEAEVGPEARVDTIYVNVSDVIGNILPVQLFTVTTTPVNNQDPLMRVGEAIEVDEGGRVPLTVGDLDISDLDTHPNEVKVIVDTPPAQGNFQNVRPAPGSETRRSQEVDSFSAHDLLQGHVHYVQTRHQGAEPRSDHVLLHVSDGVNTSPISRLNVIIHPINDESPEITVHNLHCEEASSTVLTSTSLLVTDLDTPAQDLIMAIEAMPTHGSLRRKTDKTDDPFVALQIKPGTTFSYQELLNGLIVYTHDPPVDGASTDQFSVRVTDGKYNTVAMVTVLVSARDDETPRVTVNRGLRVPPGSITTLTPLDLQASDLDSDDLRLTFTITRGPTLGRWFLAQPTEGEEEAVGDLTSPRDFHQSQVLQADAGRTRQRRGLRQGGLVSSDPGKVVSGSDGDHGGGQTTQYADLLPEPVLRHHTDPQQRSTNRPRQAGTHRRQASDRAGPRRDATAEGAWLRGGSKPEWAGPGAGSQPEWVGTEDGPSLEWAGPRGGSRPEWAGPGNDQAPKRAGPVKPRSVETGEPPRQRMGQIEISAKGHTKSFTQEELNQGFVSYAHSPEDGTGLSVTDFTVTDPEGNVLLDQTFIVDVVDDRRPPSVTTNSELRVVEGSDALLTTSFLSAVDGESDSGKLRFFIVEPPKLGYIAMVTDREMPVAEFTQENLAAGNVIYVHRSQSEDRMDRFTFAVSDGPNQVIRTFFISITSVDNKLPKVINRGLRLQEGQTQVISEFDLQIIDEDTEEEELRVTVSRLPQHGELSVRMRGDLPAGSGLFSMSDVYEGLVSYTHDGSENTRDVFLFTVSDGTNQAFIVDGESEPTTETQEFIITITPDDDGTPVLRVNNGLQFLSYRDAQATNVISPRELLSVDGDTVSSLLTYRINSGPAEGYIENNKNPGTPATSFSQGDIDEGRIRYVLTGNISALHDQMTFDLVDSKPNTLPGNVFHIEWSVIEFEEALYNVSESVGELHIPVKRHGFSKQYSVVTCGTIPDTATNDKTGLREEKNDFSPVNYQIQFEGYEDTRVCKVTITEDRVFEGPELFFVQLSHPEFSLLGEAARVTVIINDPEDEPVIQFEQDSLEITEDVGVIQVSLLRTGDLSNMASVSCMTRALTARGSTGRELLSGSDYQSRLAEEAGTRVMFASGSAHATCDVRIIDDSEFEMSESFELLLTDPSMMTRVGERDRMTVTITGPNDEAVVFFTSDEYLVDESAGRAVVVVGRAGSDLAVPVVVWCGARPAHPISALPGEDFLPGRHRVVFPPGQDTQICEVQIVEDVAEPLLEGNETFEVYLTAPEGARLGEPQVALVFINDTEEDVATMQFTQRGYTFSENTGQAEVPVLRSGDLSYETSVICYTRQQVARVMTDYVERPWTDVSRITFFPGVKEVNCTVALVEDADFEGEEEFELRLADPLGWEQCSAKVGPTHRTTLTITDPQDVPQIEFEVSSYQTSEPASPDDIMHVTVAVVRSGDTQRFVQVRYGTRDGSAVSGVDYTARSDVITFLPGVSRVTFDLEILHNPGVEWREAFTVVLGPQAPTNAMFGDVITTRITIIDSDISGSLVFPAQPIVVSLLDYDNAGSVTGAPSAGYPVVCITPCDPKHPSFAITGQLCSTSGVNQSQVGYHWEVAVPTTIQTEPLRTRGTYSPFRRITDRLPFSDCDKKVLDSVYFRPQFRVRCVVQPVQDNGQFGQPIASNAVIIGSDKSICHSVEGTTDGLHGESFMANLEYIGPEDEIYPNTIHVSVRVPHQDGLFPLVSTLPLHNLRFLLTTPTYQQQHACSNFLPKPGTSEPCFMRMRAEPAFMSPGYDLPYQFDPGMRSEDGVRLYKHLNLRSCAWDFDAYFHISELVDLCGGRVISDFEVLDKALSHLTIHLPLYVSYVYNAGCGDWSAIDHRTVLELSIMYDTMAWRAGLGEGVRVKEEDLTGDLQIMKISTDKQGRLLINFKTVPNFRGRFVPSHTARPDWTSRVLAPVDMPITFTLEEAWSQQTFDGPTQHWRARSDFNLRDFSGDYTIELVPCTVKPTDRHPGTGHMSSVCTPHTPRRFPVSLTYQQTLQPAPAQYALATEFHVTSHVDEFLLPPEETENVMGFDGVFDMGDKLYGRVLWSPDQDLEAAYRLQVEKVFLCTGSDGYVPTYDPDGELYGAGAQFGCLHPSTNLRQRYLVLDRGDPLHMVPHVQGIPFDASFASDKAEFAPMWMMPGVDGFVMNIDPLYKVDSGHVWYMQVLYVIKPASRGRHKRSHDAETVFSRETSDMTGYSKKQERSAERVRGALSSETQNGTTMRVLRLRTQSLHNIAKENISGKPISSSTEASDTSSSLTIILLSTIIGILIVTVFSLLIYWKRRKFKKRSQNGDPVIHTTNEMDLQVTAISSNAHQGAAIETSVVPSVSTKNTFGELTPLPGSSKGTLVTSKPELV